MEDSGAGRDSPHEVQTETRIRTPLPIKQLLIISMVLLTEPLTNAIVRSFSSASTSTTKPGQNLVNEDVPKAPFYSQLLQSSLFLAKAATVYHWGRLSDKLGRRPILLMGPLGLSLSTFALGVTNNAWVQTTARSMQGIFGGNIETTKAVIAEVTDNTNRHRAYAALPLVQSVGIGIGTSLGNFLSALDKRLPIVERISFIKDHPLFIPCTIAAAFSFLIFHITHHGFEETLPTEFQVDWKVLLNLRDRAKTAVLSSVPPNITSASALLDEAREVGYGAIHQIEDAAEEVVTSARQEITQTTMTLLPTDKIQEGLRLKELVSPQLIIALLNYAFISFLDQAQQTLLPLIYTAPIGQYGLGLSPNDMTQIMAKWGSYNTLAQLLFFPWLLKRYGPKKVYATCLSSMVVFFALFPVLHLAALYLEEAQYVLRNILTLHMGMSSLVYMAYGKSMQPFFSSSSEVIPGCSQLLIMDAVPDKGSIGSVNGIGQSVGSSARMVASPMISFLRTLSLKERMFGGYLVYAVLICITMIGSMISALLPRHV